MPQLYSDKRHSVTSILTAVVSRYRFVGFDGAHATQAGGVRDAQGISEEAGVAGDAISLVTGYSHEVEAGGAIPAGAMVAPSTDGTGRAVVATGANCGRAMTAAAAAGEMLLVRFVEPGIVPQSAIALVSGDRKSRRTVVPFKIWGLFQNSAGVLGQTLHATYEAPFDWIAVRLHVENMASTAQINMLAALAVSNDGTVAPTAPSGAWNNVLFSGAAAHATVACSVGAGTNDAVPTDLVSDWLTLPSIARTDGGNGRVLMLRQFVPAAGNTTGNRVPSVSSLTLALGVTRLKTYYKAGDFVTTPAGFTTPTEWDMAPAIWFEFLTAAGQVVLLAAGDSITQGADSSPIINVGGAARLTMEANQATVALCNQGWTSQKSATYYLNGLSKLAAVRPSIAALCPWSPNDTDKYTQAGVDRCVRQAMQWVDACQRADGVPALVTPAPVNGLTATDEGFRRQVVAALTAICAGGAALLIDRDAVYTDYSNTSGGFKAGLNATTLHPNGTGYALEAATAWAPVVTAIR